MTYRAVLFDLGGVVLDSPLHTIARYEREHGIPEGFLNSVVRDTGPAGAWSRMERGELSGLEFCAAFDLECSARGYLLPAAAVLERIAQENGPRPVMVEAVRRLRARGLKAAALTNNWKGDGNDRHGLCPLFDHFIESSVVGLRKPDPAIYRLAFSILEVEPVHVVFLDDIGANLKAAHALGVTTIKVVEPESALRELETLLGFDLL
ncbi:MAG TPA: HAD family phosphatase [Thermoanaerobaculia bacterium]|nr:HAD family phosphatase [Thermoanaerobaculia bacterium]